MAEIYNADSDEEGDDWQCPIVTADSPFGDFTGPVPEVLAHMAGTHGFDIQAIKRQYSLDQYGCIKLVNWLRTKIKAEPALAQTTAFATPSADEFAGDEFYMPVVADDGLLQHDYETETGEGDGGDGAEASAEARCKALTEELAQLKDEFACLRQLTEPALLGGASAAELRADADAVAVAQASDTGEDDPSTLDMDGYFKSYAHFGIHEEMLKDAVRTESYRDSMYKNKEYFKGKIVLDVGCGSGVLSMMAARAGAAMVIGVDNSSVILTAEKIVKENGLEKVVTLIQGKIEEVELPVPKVDVIISEWMGYFLVFESMLDSVIFARDKWLAPGGVVLPDNCSIHVVAINDPDRTKGRLDFWSDVYGFKMESMRAHLFREPDITVMDAEAIASEPCCLKTIDCMTTSVADVEFSSPFTLSATKPGTCGGLCVYFDIGFEAGLTNPIFFSTGPAAIPTHWKQTLFYFDHPLEVEAGGVITGTLSGKRVKEYHRQWDVTITYQSGSSTEVHTQDFRI